MSSTACLVEFVRRPALQVDLSLASFVRIRFTVASWRVLTCIDFSTAYFNASTFWIRTVGVDCAIGVDRRLRSRDRK